MSNHELNPIIFGLIQDLKIDQNEIDYMEIYAEALQVFEKAETRITVSYPSWNYPQVREMALEDTKMYLMSTYVE
ncbi:hypothetical protein [Marinoscillum sp.]|uniref:hypothetical protein n=1 Tax=Marinoscillum sp. TaxID=2024838 RepID=UPI003BA9D802